jgi:hypothetical protein
MTAAALTMPDMGGRKQPPGGPRPPAKVSRKPAKRRGVSLHIYLDPKVHARLLRFAAAQRIPPSNTDVVELALGEFLDREGVPHQ